MDTNTKYSIFISYSTENESLISKLVDFLKNSLGLDKKDIFCTVDFRSITTGDKFHDKIFNSIRNSQICISVITPQSAYDPWVLCESGGAYTHYIEDEKRFMPVCALGMKKSSINLPAPLSYLQFRDLTNIDEIIELLNDIKNILGCSINWVETDAKDLSDTASCGDQKWDLIQPCFVVKRSKGSPYDSINSLKNAKKRVMFVGQNINHISSTKEVHDEIYRFIDRSDENYVDILIMSNDEVNESAIKAWNDINAEVPGRNFIDQLDKAIDRCKKLLYNKDKHHKRLRIKTFHKLISLAFTIIDPEEDAGIMIVRPFVNHGYLSGDRPEYIISKKRNLDVFEYYWDKIKTIWDEEDEATPLA